MINLIASVSAQEIYNMDNHMYSGISIAISILSVLIGIIAIVAGVYGWMTFQNLKKRMNGLENLQEAKDKETDEKIKRTNKIVDKKITELSVLKDDINKNLDEIKKNVFDTNVMNIINILEISEENNDNFSITISGSLNGLWAIIPVGFNNLKIFHNYLEHFGLMLMVLEMNLNKINLKSCEKILDTIIKIREDLKISRLDCSMGNQKISEKIVDEENNINDWIKKIKKNIKDREKRETTNKM